jgi:hypothetical protein
VGEETVFSASWDRTVWIISSVFALAFVVVTIALVMIGLHAMDQSRATGMTVLVLAGLTFGMLVVTACFSPIDYRVTSDHLVVRRAGRDVRVAVSEIAGVEVVHRETVFRRSMRTPASGGPFGFFGRWRSPGLGEFTAYVTRRDRLVLVHRKERDPIVISPDLREDFIRALRDRLARAAEPGARS